MDDVSLAMLAPIFADIEARVKDTRFNAIAGVVSAEDMSVIFRRAAQKHGCTPEDAKRWWEARQTAPTSN